MTTTYAPSPKPRRSYVFVGLVLLSAVPVVAGVARAVEVLSGAEVTAENARFVLAPTPILVHIASSIVFALAGAAQFWPRLRRTRNALHRAMGRVLIPAGVLVAGSGLWMTATYEPPPADGIALTAMRWAVGVFMLFALGRGALAIWQQQFAVHGAWLTRAYAVALGAGTQVFTHLPWVLLYGQPSETPRAVLMGAGWGINLVIAEWVIRRRRLGR